MGDINKPKPVLHFCGAISAPGSDIAAARAALEESFGAISSQSKTFPFTETTYYEGEMGNGLSKVFFAFEKLIDPGEIAAIKIRTNEIEAGFAAAGNRSINLDPGYISTSKLVLATTKDNYHRVYIRDGIYAETTLQFIGGTFIPFQWTYPDYRKEEYIEFFNALREEYKRTLREIPGD